MQKPLVSIVVPCYKKAQYLPEALDSILAQTYRNWECVIVNDGSPDNTEEVALAYCEKDARFHYLSQVNQGVSAARNNGIKQMKGKYILALDSDDWISDTYIEKAVLYLEEHKEAKLVFSQYDCFGEGGYYEVVIPDYSYERFVMGDMAIVCSAVYRRTDFDLIGGYDENMLGNEDWDFWLSMLHKEDEVYRIDEVLFHYRLDSSLVSLKVSQDEQYFRNKLCRKHRDIYEPMYVNVLYYYYRGYQKYEQLSKELEVVRKVYSSKAYRLGKFVLKPFSWIRRVFLK